MGGGSDIPKKMLALGVITTFIVTSLLLLAGCVTSMDPSERGAVTGAGLGAAGGTVFGAIAGSAGKGAFVGSAVGVVAGLMVGKAIEGEQATTPYRAWNGDTAPPPPYAPTLQVEVTPDETEVSVDGIRVGLAKELYGPVRVPVRAGPHVVECSWRGFRVTETIVASPWTTVLIKRGLRSAASVASLTSRPSSPTRSEPSCPCLLRPWQLRERRQPPARLPRGAAAFFLTMQPQRGTLGEQWPLR